MLKPLHSVPISALQHKVKKAQIRNCRFLKLCRNLPTMASTRHPLLGSPTSHALHNIAYTNCKTRIVNLKKLNIPENATEAEYRQMYHDFINSRPRSEAAESLESAIQSLTGGIAPPVAFPTETVYGLGADATNSPAVYGIFAAKGRPSDNPLIVHVASKEHLERLTGQPIPQVYEELVKQYWPGALTILVPISETDSTFATNVHPGQRTIGFRVPSSKYARFLISACDKPIAAPSANSSGKPSPTTAQHVFDDLNGKINFILDGGSCDVGVESTVVDGLSDPPMILRPGGVSRRDLVQFGRKTGSAWERVAIEYKEHGDENEETTSRSQNRDKNTGILTNGHKNGSDDDKDRPSGTETPRAPGMKYKHYAPQGKLLLFESPSSTDMVYRRFATALDETMTPTSKQVEQAYIPQASNNSSSSTTQTVSGQPCLNVAILTTSSWPDFAGLHDVTDSKSNCLLSSLEVEPPTATRYESSIAIKSTTLGFPSSNAVSTHPYSSINLYTLSLGQSPTEIAHSLFSALRICDDLGANYIFAEAPRYIEGHEGRDWEVVMERMGKAASQVVKANT